MNKRQSVSTLISISLVLMFAGMLALPMKAGATSSPPPPCGGTIPEHKLDFKLKTLSYFDPLTVVMDPDPIVVLKKTAETLPEKHTINYKVYARTWYQGEISDWNILINPSPVTTERKVDDWEKTYYKTGPLVNRCVAAIMITAAVYTEDGTRLITQAKAFVNPDWENTTIISCNHFIRYDNYSFKSSMLLDCLIAIP